VRQQHIATTWSNLLNVYLQVAGINQCSDTCPGCPIPEQPHFNRKSKLYHAPAHGTHTRHRTHKPSDCGGEPTACHKTVPSVAAQARQEAYPHKCQDNGIETACLIQENIPEKRVKHLLHSYSTTCRTETNLTHTCPSSLNDRHGFRMIMHRTGAWQQAREPMRETCIKHANPPLNRLEANLIYPYDLTEATTCTSSELKLAKPRSTLFGQKTLHQ
jgi:hypothetical protein